MDATEAASFSDGPSSPDPPPTAGSSANLAERRVGPDDLGETPETSLNGVLERLLDGLTEPQLQVVTHVDGPLLVLAGPGSGKTRVITSRLAYLNQVAGIAPWHLLAITFTNKAAGEMRDRVGKLIPENAARRMTVATFHALCARLLRRYAEPAGLKPGYAIYDTGDQKAAIKAALDDLEISAKNFPPAAVLNAISDAKNKLIGPESFAENASNFYDRTIAKLYSAYQRNLERNGAVDFDDLLMKTVQLLRREPRVAEELRDRFRYILIDEYQDTNHAQFMIAATLAAGRNNIMATGDPDQSIYGWRGADVKNIMDFESHFPNPRIIALEQNYRSTQNILTAADGLIQHNTQRRHKRLFTENSVGTPVKVIKVRDERAEAEVIADQLWHHHQEDGIPYGSMAIFYRMNSLSRVLEDELRHRGMPYQIARGTAFYDRKEIRDVIAYLRVIANPADEVNLMRVINTPARGISKKTTDAMRAFALANNLPIDQVMANPMALTNLNTRAQTAVARFSEMAQAWRARLPFERGGSLRGLVEDVIRGSGLHDFYRNDKTDPDQERLANLGEFVSSAQQFEEEFEADPEMFIGGPLGKIGPDGEEIFDAEAPDGGSMASRVRFDEPTAFDLQTAQDEEELEILFGPAEPDDAPKAPPPGYGVGDKLLAFLERISLIADADAVSADETGSITLMTLHAAKGLEFPVVALAGFEDGMLPHERSVRESADGSGIEEERRLAFVGITRAMKHLYISVAGYRTVFGQPTPTIPSRFLRELPEDVIEHDDQTDALGGFLDSPEGPSGIRSRGRGQAGRQRGTNRGSSGMGSWGRTSRQATSVDPGTRVKHPRFGHGEVLSVDAIGQHTRVKVEFASEGIRTLVLEYAQLEMIP